MKILGGALASLLLAALTSSPVAAQTVPADLLPALREGGLVIVMRHGSSPREEPDAATANPDNTNRERQLDEAGRAAASAMGEALRRLGVPIGRVLASPTYRTVETARLLGFPEPETFEELATSGGMTPDPQGMELRGAWLRERTGEAPAPGVDTLIITHGPNAAAAFTELTGGGPEEGECLLFRPTAASPVLIGRIKIDEWPMLESAN